MRLGVAAFTLRGLRVNVFFHSFNQQTERKMRINFFQILIRNVAANCYLFEIQRAITNWMLLLAEMTKKMTGCSTRTAAHEQTC